MIYIADRFGFVSEFFWGEDKFGKRVYKARHCIDMREALPFKNRLLAENEYRKTYMADWWHCTLSSGSDTDADICPCPPQAERILSRHDRN